MFRLATQLENDCQIVDNLPLCQVLLVKDINYPWLILVPRVEDAKDIIDLSPDDQAQLWRESALVSECLRRLYQPDKLNVAALGNMVAQLHVHHIVRFTDDLAWPKPVWGVTEAKPYGQDQLTQTVSLLRHEISVRKP
jgi:diadenosine tetraphosphate (Ap4A) HIT family hydrolase